MSEFQRKKIRPWDDLESLLPKSNQLVTNKESNSNQLNNKKVTNKESISNQLVTKETKAPSEKVTNKEPISNLISNLISNRNKESIDNQLVTDFSNQLVTNPEAKIAIKRLTGLQKKILFFVVDRCVSEGHLVTNPITNETLREITKTNANTIKTAVQRLVSEKRLIQRIEGKRGKGGFSCFAINRDIRNAVIEEKKSFISNQLVTQLVTNNSNQLVTNKVSNKEPTASSSSSDITINKNTTTTELPPEWQIIDFSELHKRNINFNQGHLVSLWPFLKSYTSIDFQDSIDGFIYDLDHKHLKPDKGALNVLIGVIRRGALYTSAYYVSPAQQRINEIIANGEKMREQRFLAWVEENHIELYKRIREHSASLAIDFNHRGKESMSYVKEHLYLKMLKEEKA